MKLKNPGQLALVLASYFFSFVLLRISGFSASSIVNSQNYILKSAVLSTTGMSTIQAVYFVAKPFLPVVASLIIFALGIAFVIHWFSEKSWIPAAGGAIIAFGFFPSIWGAFLAAAVFVSAYYAGLLGSAYSKEIRRWVGFRTGSRAAGRALLVFNIMVAVGLFFAVISAQASYEASFRHDLVDSMGLVAMAVPGASSMPPGALDEKINSAIASSPLFTAYIRWLPVTSAFSAWVMLEVLRNLLLANASGLFTWALKRKQ